MSDEIWRKECRAYLSTLPGYARAGFSSKQAEMVYIEAKKYSQLKIEELERKLEMTKKALEFYANVENWHTSYFAIITPTSSANQIIMEDLSFMVAEDNSYRKNIGGKRARQCLKELEGEE